MQDIYVTPGGVATQRLRTPAPEHHFCVVIHPKTCWNWVISKAPVVLSTIPTWASSGFQGCFFLLTTGN